MEKSLSQKLSEYYGHSKLVGRIGEPWEDVPFTYTGDTDFVTHFPIILPSGPDFGGTLSTTDVVSTKVDKIDEEVAEQEEAGEEGETGDVSGGAEPDVSMLKTYGPGSNLPIPALEEPMSAKIVGRIFELKKIYSRLLAIESQLTGTTEKLLMRLKEYISRAIELFETLVSNINYFKDQVDDIIVVFYEFLDAVYAVLRKYYKKKMKKEKIAATKKIEDIPITRGGEIQRGFVKVKEA